VNSGAALGLTFAALVGAGLVAGVFFAFSTFVMAALRRLPAPQGITAMQSINVTVLTPLFMLALFGTALACVALAVMALIDWDEPGAALVFAGAVAYLLGAIVTTTLYHVPRNLALDNVDANATDAPRYWSVYFTEWTRMNHVRTLGSLAACTCFAISLQIG
jgi:uncharacterized membrane protein